MASMYSAKVMEHFANPHNVGELPDANGVGEVGNPKCGDIMRMYLKIENNVIVDVKFLTFGCGAAIATSSMATDLIKGKTVDEAQSRPSRLLCPTTTAVRASIRNPSWASWKRTVSTARAAATDPDSILNKKEDTASCGVLFCVPTCEKRGSEIQSFSVPYTPPWRRCSAASSCCKAALR